MNQQTPSQVIARYVEWRAYRIDDPVERLRYLRSRSAALLATPSDKRKVRWHWIRILVIILCSGFAILPFRSASIASVSATLPDAAPAARAQDLPPDSVWQIEQTAAYENYSNGLRIEKQYTVANSPRTRYRLFRQERPSFDKFEWKKGIAGIVYHTTESHVAAFEQANTAQQNQADLGTISDVQRRRCYNYVIDRYGRVWRVVDENSVAWHAGRSIWSGPGGTFVDVNESFLGVAFEAKTYDQSQSTAKECRRPQ